jgi:hypothetical protein
MADDDYMDEVFKLAKSAYDKATGEAGAGQPSAAEPSANGPAKPGNKKSRRGDKQPTQADNLLALAGTASYVHTAEGKAFALVNVGTGAGRHVETLSLRTKPFRNWLAREYYRATTKAASAKSTEDVLRVLEARANYDGPERAVHLRVAEAPGKVYLDLGDANWQAVVIDARGWRLAAADAPLFRRPRGLLPLPAPARDGTLDELRSFVNLTYTDWILAVAWLVQAACPHGPYPVLNLYGEHGTAKSTTARVLKSLLDPNAAPLRSRPRDERDLAIAAGNSWCVVLDNLSHLDPWLSDAICRLSTGGGFATRELFTDEDEVIFDAMRPVVLDGIEDLASRGDLLDRSLLLRLPPIDDGQRRTEADFWRDFEPARPRLLGALLDVVSGVLRELPRVRLPVLPRMADFGLLGVAVERVMGWPAGSFLEAYTSNRDDATVAALESSLIFPALEQFVQELPARVWEGTYKLLLTEISRIAGDAAKSKFWPTTPRSLSCQLRRLAPSLRAAKIAVEFVRTEGTNGRRIVRVTRGEGE